MASLTGCQSYRLRILDMRLKLIALILLTAVMVGLAWNIERTARPVTDHDAAATLDHHDD